MNGFGEFKETSDRNDLNKEEKSEISLEIQNKFAKTVDKWF